MALCEWGVEAELRIVEGAIHLFDASDAFMRNEEAASAVREGYEFLVGSVERAQTVNSSGVES